jgi:Ssp1 endopeptidase immunity protein Rap1a
MRTAVLVAGLLLTTAVAAKAMTGEELANACRSRSEQCDVYLSGCLDSRESFLEWHYLIENMYCAKGSLSADQARDIFLKYAQQHPQRLRERAPTLLFTALSESLPCK